MRMIVARRSPRFIPINCDSVVVRESNDTVVIECVPPGTPGAKGTYTKRVVDKNGKLYVYRGVKVRLEAGIYSVSKERDRVIIKRV